MFCSPSSDILLPVRSGDLDLLGDRGGGIYVVSIGCSSPGARRDCVGVAMRPGGGCRWNCELCKPLCTSLIAVEMIESLDPDSGLRRGSCCVGGGSGSALKGGSSTERSFTIRAIEAVCTVAGSSSSMSNMDRCSSSESPLIGRAGSDFPLPFE